MQISEYLETAGNGPFSSWFGGLSPQSAVRVRSALARMEVGNLSNVKSVGAGVLEFRIDFGPGYRVYFGKDGDKPIILLAGGSKQRQQRDIVAAQERWDDYKRRKRKGR